MDFTALILAAVSTAAAAVSSSPVTYEPDMSLTTAFNAPSGCGRGFTAIATETDIIWQDLIVPAAGVTVASCYPSQFVASVLASPTPLPAFSKIVCPTFWEAYMINSTYTICCPQGFGLHAPNLKSSDRPAAHAICSSQVFPGVQMDITVYDTSGSTSVAIETVDSDGMLVFATPFDGITTIPVSVTTSSTPITTPTSSRSSSVPPVTPFTTTTAPGNGISMITTAPRTSTTSTTAKPRLPAASNLPSCGELCWNNMLGQFADLGCTGVNDAACLCRNLNFGYGLRDCSNGACGTQIASTVLAFSSTYCSIAGVTAVPTPTTTTGPSPTDPSAIAALPSCGQTCVNNMLGQYAALGCTSAEPACLCKNINFGYGIRDCSNAVCDAAAASAVISFASAYCAAATAAPARFR